MTINDNGGVFVLNNTLCFILYIVLISLGTNAFGQEAEKRVFERVKLISAKPSHIVPGETETIYYGFLCYSWEAGGLVECPVTFELHESTLPVQIAGFDSNCAYTNGVPSRIDSCADGGHRHLGLDAELQREVLLAGERVEYPEHSAEDGVRVITDATTGFFIPGTFFVPASLFNWLAPIAGGVYSFEATMQPGEANRNFWIFDGASFTRYDEMKTNGKVIVAVNSLIQLPSMPDTYKKGRNPDVRHVDADAFAVDRLTATVLRSIAALHLVGDGRRVSYNDSSLPYGGIFDIRGTWIPSHTAHRDGRQIDINRFLRADGTTRITCRDNTSIKAAIDVYLTPEANTDGTQSALLCEDKLSGFDGKKGTYHLRTTSLKPLPAILAGILTFDPQKDLPPTVTP